MGFSLFLIRPLVKAKVSNKIEIDLSNLVALPKSIVQKTESPCSEPVRSAGSPKTENIKPLAQVKPVDALPAPENNPVVKFNEEIVKPVKVERAQEKPIPVTVIEKPEEKKVQTQNPAPVQAQAEPKPAEVIAPLLLAVVDKKIKIKTRQRWLSLLKRLVHHRVRLTTLLDQALVAHPHLRLRVDRRRKFNPAPNQPLLVMKCKLRFLAPNLLL